MGCGRSAGQKGFTYIWVLFVVTLTSIALAGAVQVWRTEVRREKEKELMFAGEQFRQAIGSYYENSPGPKRYPDSLEKLLLDKRFPTVKRHLRKIFFDPMTGSGEWGLARQPNAGIIGVYSLSKEIPLKRANFPERYADFAEAKDYRDWKFIYLPGDPATTSSQTQAAPADPPATPLQSPSEGQTGDIRPQTEAFGSQPRPESERGAPSPSSPFSLSPSPSDQEDPRFLQPDSSPQSGSFPQNVQY